jgi:hypothetical protein
MDEDLPVENRQGWSYKIHSEHRWRGDFRKKSRWTITTDDEYGCFCDCHPRAGWFDGDIGWGLHIRNTRPVVLGKFVPRGGDPDHPEDTSFAKFVSQNDKWHGFPINLKRDEIPDDVVDKWFEQGLIWEHELRWIKQGAIWKL